MQAERFWEDFFREGVPLSFRYGGEQAGPQFGPLTRTPEADGEGYEAWSRVLLRSDGEKTSSRISGPQVFRAELKIRRYREAVEWWLEVSGEGIFDSRIVDCLSYADLTLSDGKPFHGSDWKYPRWVTARGSLAQEDDFQPLAGNFLPESKHIFSCGGGRSSSGQMPYFNLLLSEKSGVLFAVGWSGQWKAVLERLGGETRPVRVSCGMEDACFRVQPGEKLVLPKMLALPWEGELEDSFNLFRRFMRRNILPRYDGKPLKGYVCLRTWGGLPPEIHRKKIENVKKHGLPAELYQIDAGWHGDGTTPASSHDYFDLWPQTVGIWKPLPALFPDGIGSLGRRCRDAGMGFAVWFEPERMPSWNRIVSEHREYFIGPKLPDAAPEGGIRSGQYYLMLDLGYGPAREWITDQISRVITESGMEVFRLDFNYEPLPFWQRHDGPDRRGVTEIRYINGLYAMLDELLRRHPGLKIDNCASGGRRLDYRMFRRSMPMICRSDYFCGRDNEPDPKQAHTYGLSFWIPAHADSLGSCIGHTSEVMDTYRVRSSLSSGIGMTAPWWDLSEKEAAWYRKMLAEASEVREYVSDDFHPLTGYTLSPMDWMAFQFFRPEDGSGMVMAFRREESATDMMTFTLRGIEAGGRYLLRDADLGELGEVPGSALGTLTVKIPEKRSSRILFYRKKD